jgi:hypothetical protein
MDKSQRICRNCWEPYTIGGKHVCKPKATKASPAPSPHIAVKNAEPVKNGVKNAVKNASPSPKTSTVRTRKWRDAHGEDSRQYMRDYMRRKRAAEAVKAAAQ